MTNTSNSNKTKYNLDYAKEKLKRVPLDLQKSFYEELQIAAADLGESVNGFIKKAIQERLEMKKDELERIRRERAEQERIEQEGDYQGEGPDVSGFL